LDRAEWLQFGIEQGYCSPPVCITHDGWPTTAAEDEEDDACIHMMRPYVDEADQAAVEANSAPAVWRKAGWVDVE